MKLPHPLTPTTHVVIQRLDVENVIFHLIMLFHYQALMDYPCPLTDYLDIALVAIGTQDAAVLKLRQQGGRQLLVALVQQDSMPHFLQR